MNITTPQGNKKKRENRLENLKRKTESRQECNNRRAPIG